MLVVLVTLTEPLDCNGGVLVIDDVVGPEARELASNADAELVTVFEVRQVPGSLLTIVVVRYPAVVKVKG